MVATSVGIKSGGRLMGTIIYLHIVVKLAACGYDLLIVEFA